MTLTHGLLALVGLGFVALLPFALAELWLSLRMVLLRTRIAPVPQSSHEPSVTVLIPAHNEGAGLADAVRCVREQDYDGAIFVQVLIKDSQDTSVKPLTKAFSGLKKASGGLELRVSDKRSLRVVFTGVAPKREKLEQALRELDTELVAFLDADHRPEGHWLRASAARLQRDDLDVVQARRRPLAALGFAQIWDSAQNHIGNEVVNHVTAAAGLNVMFTGTGAVFRARVFEKHRFADCITEDTYLSLDIILAGGRIGYLPDASSYEEVAPGLRAFVARRRRWSAGHTKTFLSHFGAIGRSTLPLKQKLHLLVHGAFYLGPVAAVLVFCSFATYSLVQLPWQAKLGTAFMSILTGVVAVRLLGSRGKRALLDAGVFAAWLWPQTVFGFIALYALSDHPLYYYLLTFPYPEIINPLQIIFLGGPALVLIVGWVKLRGLHATQMAALLISYPLMLFFEIYAVLVGLVDLALGLSTWTAIQRNARVEAAALPAKLRKSLATATATRVPWTTFGLVAIVLTGGMTTTNEVLSEDNCGEIRPFLWHPWLAHAGGDLDFKPRVTKRLVGDETEITIDGHLRGLSQGQTVELRSAYGGEWRQELATAETGELKHTTVVRVPNAWRVYDIELQAHPRGTPFICERGLKVDGVVREIRGERFLINGEPFLVKGLIPSFGLPPLGKSPDEGLRQVKDVGANSVRFYHAPTESELAASAQHQLLFMAQPKESTWNNIRLANRYERRALVQRRYHDLIRDTAESPYRLMDNLGNELELGQPESQDDGVKWVREMVTLAREGHDYRFPLTYSTYLVFAGYPTDVVSINMLDVGDVYWNDGLSLAQHTGKPLLASELGGFVAFFERTSPLLRMERMYRHWQSLFARNALGAFFYQSHDNWAQAVPVGSHNDPLTPDQPDDTRGYWTRDDAPKDELIALRDLFADIEQELLRSARTESGWMIRVRNRRPYALRGVQFSVEGQKPLEWGDLAANAEAELQVPASHAEKGRIEGVLSYTTHRGLSSRYRWTVELPFSEGAPRVMNRDFVPHASTDASTLRGALVHSNELLIAAPKQSATVIVNGRVVPVQAGVAKVAVQPSRRPFSEVQVRGPNGEWHPFAPNLTGGGMHQVRFALPSDMPKDARLVLAGLGTGEMTVMVNEQTRGTLGVHSYRESFFDPVRWGAGPGAVITLTLDRQWAEYVNAQSTPTGAPIRVALERPSLYVPATVTVEQ